MIYPASTLMGWLGRRGGFMFKAAIGVLGGAICAVALLIASFALLIAGPFLGGNLANLVAAVPYVSAFVVLSVVCICLAASQVFLSDDLGRDTAGAPAASPAPAFAFNPGFAKASAICAVGFAV